MVYNFPKDSSRCPIPQWRSIVPRNKQPPTSQELMAQERKNHVCMQEFRSILWSSFPADVRILMDPIFRRRKLIEKQQRQVSKVLLDGLYDPNSSISMLRGDHHVVMKGVWQALVKDWQIFTDQPAMDSLPTECLQTPPHPCRVLSPKEKVTGKKDAISKSSEEQAARATKRSLLKEAKEGF